MNSAPCKDCLERSETCHITCKQYQSFVEDLKELKRLIESDRGFRESASKIGNLLVK